MTIVIFQNLIICQLHYMSDSFSALILAGGFSKRMNYPKAFLDYNGKTFLKSITSIYQKASITNTVTVLNSVFCANKWKEKINDATPYTSIVENHHPESGRFYSIKTGVENIGDADYCFIQNIDNPFLTKEILLKLIEKKNKNGYTIPTYLGKGGHPILISKKIIDEILSSSDLGINFRIILSCFERREVAVNDNRILFNINTSEDYEKLIQQNCKLTS